MTTDSEAEKELARACADSMYERDVAAHALGVNIEDVGPGYARLGMTVRENMLNGHGVCHGGFIFALADTAFAYACNSRDMVNLAQHCSIDFLAPSRVEDRLCAEAVQHHQANRTGLYDVTVTRGDGSVVARFRGRSYRVRGRVLEGDVRVGDGEPETDS